MAEQRQGPLVSSKDLKHLPQGPASIGQIQRPGKAFLQQLEKSGARVIERPKRWLHLP